MRGALVVCLLVVVAIVGCSSAAGGPSVSSTSVLLTLGSSRAPVEPGRYVGTVANGSVALTFDVTDASWLGAQEGEDFYLEPPGDPGGLTVIHFDGSFAEDGCTENFAAGTRSAAALIDDLSRDKIVKDLKKGATSLAGYPAVQLDVRAAVGSVCSGATSAPIWGVKGSWGLQLVDGEAARFIAADVNGATLVVIVDAYNPADLPPLLAKAQPIILSLAMR
jgi:hypothetical protein